MSVSTFEVFYNYIRFLKKLKINELETLSSDIRKYIIDNLDKNLDKIVVCDKNVEKIVKDIVKSENKTTKVEINSKYLNQYDYEKQIKKLENRKIYMMLGSKP